MSKITDLLKKRSRPSSSSLSMLDVVSNALAATMCLFFSLSAMQMHPLPERRVLGKLIFECRLAPDRPGAEPPLLFLEAPDRFQKHWPAQYGRDILNLNYDDPARVSDVESDEFLPINVFVDPDNPLSLEIHVTDPIEDAEYRVGAIYVDHAGFGCGEPERARLHFSALFDDAATKETWRGERFDTAFAAPARYAFFAAKAPKTELKYP